MICDLDFNKINVVLMRMSEDAFMTPEKAFNLFKDKLVDYLYIKTDTELLDKVYFNGVNTVTYEVLMKEYIENSLALYRRNFVFANIKYRSNVTGEKAYDLKGEDFKVKQRYWKQDYSLRRHSVFFYDESTLDPDKLNLNWQEKSKVDDGTIEHLRLFRHFYKGTSFYVTTLQNVGRLNKSERELFNTIIKIESMNELCYSKTLKSFAKFLYRWNERINQIKIKFISKKKRAVLDNCITKYKVRKKKILYLMDILNSKDQIVYNIRLYNRTKQAENETRDYEEARLIFNKQDCFGCIDTHEFSYNYDASLEQSKKTPEVKLDDSTLENKIELANRSMRVLEKIKI